MLCLLLTGATAQRVHAAEWRTSGRFAWSRGTAEGMEVSPATRLRLVSFAGTNVAQGVRGKVDGRNVGTRLTDGNRATMWNFLDDPEVLGREVTLDLKGNRLIDRVRVLPPEGDQNPEFFIKGYRIEVANQETPDGWQVVARQALNLQRVIDTTLDSSWTVTVEGVPTPIIARFVRIVITRQDLPNRVEIGEVEVLGAGFQAAGQYTSIVRDFGSLVNVGGVSWQIETPDNTRLRLQLRTSVNNVIWPDWEDVPKDAVEAEVTRAAVGPVRFVQWRLLAETFDPLMSPDVASVSVTFERQLVARSARGRLRPRQAPIGVPVLLSYVADLQITADNRGVDLIALDRWGDVEEVRMDGIRLSPSDYRIVTIGATSAQVPQLALRLRAESRLTASTRLELDFTTAFFIESTPIGLLLGSAQGDSTVLQRVTPFHQDSIKVEVAGVLDRLIPASSVRVVPRVVRPGSAGTTRFHFELGRVQAAIPVSVSIFDLSGRIVRHLLREQLLYAGPIAISWDGYGDDGRPLAPGIYVWKIEAQAERHQTVLRTVGVAY